MIAASEIGPDGEVRFNRPPADQRFLEPYSGVYFQISGAGETFPSRSLWDRRLNVDTGHKDVELHKRDSYEFAPDEPLRILERDVILPGRRFAGVSRSPSRARRSTTQITPASIHPDLEFCRLASACWCLPRCRPSTALAPSPRAPDVASIRSGEQRHAFRRICREVRPLSEEINQLLAHSEEQAEEARRHAGNLAHALKTPLTVITNAATARAPDLADAVCREATVMRRQVDHHLARARAIGRRASAHARATVWESADAVQRAVDRLYEDVTVDIAGDREAQVRVERQDLDEMLGNLVENAAKYGGGRVFVTVVRKDAVVDILVEDDGKGIPEQEREAIFQRGARLDTDKPGTGLGLAIVRDVAEIYGGRITLEESEDLGGLLARLSLPVG